MERKLQQQAGKCGRATRHVPCDYNPNLAPPEGVGGARGSPGCHGGTCPMMSWLAKLWCTPGGLSQFHGRRGTFLKTNSGPFARQSCSPLSLFFLLCKALLVHLLEVAVVDQHILGEVHKSRRLHCWPARGARRASQIQCSALGHLSVRHLSVQCPSCLSLPALQLPSQWVCGKGLCHALL